MSEGWTLMKWEHPVWTDIDKKVWRVRPGYEKASREEAEEHRRWIMTDTELRMKCIELAQRTGMATSIIIEAAQKYYAFVTGQAHEEHEQKEQPPSDTLHR
jgi:hypothetical protein